MKAKKITEHVLIGTPDKVLDWANKFLELNRIRVFVMDEADVMISTKGHQDESFHIRRHLPPNCQIMLFSATYDERMLHCVQVIVPNAIIIRIKQDEEALEHIKQFYVICEHKDAKYAAAVTIYKVLYIGQAFIFCQGRKTADWLAKKMTNDGCSVALLSGDLTVQQRLAVLDRFRDGKEKILITTMF
uniref:RNA helicase n=1 Tax=Triatoma infestans TaxID=30076 RepID=A0A161MNN2_TRIIF